MMLGVVGPMLVLFHANFSLGATNSNVALICMLVVAGSGVVGRYIYTRLHAQLDGNEDTLEQLKAVGERLRSQTTSISFLPGLLDAIDRVEERLIAPPKGLVGRFFHLITGGPRGALARWQVHREISHAVETAAQQESALIARHAQRIAMVARRYADRRLEAGRPCRGVSDVRTAVFILACAAHPAVLHAADCRHRARRRDQRVLTSKVMREQGGCHTSRSIVVDDGSVLARGVTCSQLTVETLLMPGKVTPRAHEAGGDLRQLPRSHATSAARPRCASTATRRSQATCGDHLRFHGRMPNSGVGECRACHTEHKGREADIVQLEPRAVRSSPHRLSRSRAPMPRSNAVAATRRAKRGARRPRPAPAATRPTTCTAGS